jgi:hypothetical protein
LEDPGAEGMIILKWISEKWSGGHRLDRSGDGWRAVVNAVMNLQVLYMVGNFSTSKGSLSYSGRSLPQGISYFIYGLYLFFRTDNATVNSFN